MVFSLLGAIIVLSFGMVLHLENHRKHFKSRYYNIMTDEFTDYVHLNPKDCYHDTTLIFLDSNLKQNNKFL
jgi:hypothetical protein